MGNEQLIQFISAALSTGSGAVILWVLDRIAEWVADDGQQISPKSKRRLALLLSAVVPTVLYLILVALQGPYQWPVHLMNVGLAFISNQALHGETKLATGDDVRKAERLKAFERMPLAGSDKAPDVVFEDGTEVK